MKDDAPEILHQLPEASEDAPDRAPALRETARIGRIDEQLPAVGSYWWVTVTSEEPEGDDDDKFYGFVWAGPALARRQPAPRRKKKGGKRKPIKNVEEQLMCVEHVASNHVSLGRYEAYTYDGGSSDTQERSIDLSFADFFTYCRPATDWKETLNKRMDAVREAMTAETKRLYDEAQKANALPSGGEFRPTEAAPFALAIRTLDPAREKRALVNLQKRIPVVAKNIKFLAREQAAISKMLMAPEMNVLQVMKKKLEVVEDKIFTLEVYAGLQEEVKQIADGEPAGADSKLTVRQSLLFMDEETLVDYDKGGMDFRKLDDFDEWVARPESIARILPETRGIVAFRVRRNKKDYGPASDLWTAWQHAQMNAFNMATYLLIRNGEKIYRIASEVDFQPRLIPLRNEFEGAFTEKHRKTYGRWVGEGDSRKYIPDEYDTELIKPDDFRYDDHAAKIRGQLKHYNRIVVLLQGLLDRSEVFHPHPPINLANVAEMEEWLNLIRDEEDVLGAGSLSETWEDYRARLNSGLEKGDWIWQSYDDGRKRPGEAFGKEGAPSIIQVAKRRKGNKGDVVPRRTSGYGQHYRVETEGRSERECVGIDGVEVEWKWTATVYPRDRYRNSFDKEFTGRMWIPLEHVFNLMAYRRGDFRKFLCDRTQKGKYLEWAGPLLSAEDWHMKMEKL